MNGLSGINIELTSRCCKSCWCCGRRKREKENPEVLKTYGDMEFSLLEKIAPQIPEGVVVQLHNNGEPLMYHRFGDAVKLFRHCLTSIDTNGKLLVEKGCEIVDNLDTIAVSVIENDPDADEQYEILKQFLRLKGKFKPLVVLRLNGSKIDVARYKDLDCLIATRVLHSPMGSFDYAGRETTKPEIGVCWEILHRLAIDRNGDVSICVRFDPERKGVLGNVKEQSLEEIWTGAKRKEWLSLHKQGKRADVPLCSKCDYWGLPTGW
jgi:MoaA/NifB/PqqE/SkfB family radical SAM enzyme